MSYYILNEEQYHFIMSMLLANNKDFKVSQVSTLCGEPIKKANLSPYCISFTETKNEDTGETIIEGRAAVMGKFYIDKELMLSNPEASRNVAYDSISKHMTNQLVEGLTWPNRLTE